MYYYRIYGMQMTADLEFPQLLTDGRWETGTGTAGNGKSMQGGDGKTADRKETGEKGQAVGDSDTAGEGGCRIVVSAGYVSERIPEHPSDRQYAFSGEFSWLENKTCYILVEDGCRITYQKKEGANEMYLRSYLLGWGMSMLAHQRLEPAIHCSAVCHGKDAVLLCGESGSGKSTMTTALLEQGYNLMADDMALVEYRGEQGAWVKPAFPYQKLCRDAALRSGYPMEDMIYIDEDKDKFLVPCKERFEKEPRKISAMVLLRRTDGEEVRVRQLRGMDVFYAFANNLFLRHLLKEKKYEPAIGQKCLEIASCVPVYIIGRPWGKDTLAEVKDELFRILDI